MRNLKTKAQPSRCLSESRRPRRRSRGRSRRCGPLRCPCSATARVHRQGIAFQTLARQLGALADDHVEVILGQLAPAHPDSLPELRPIPSTVRQSISGFLRAAPIGGIASCASGHLLHRATHLKIPAFGRQQRKLGWRKRSALEERSKVACCTMTRPGEAPHSARDDALRANIHAGFRASSVARNGLQPSLPDSASGRQRAR